MELPLDLEIQPNTAKITSLEISEEKLESEIRFVVNKVENPLRDMILRHLEAGGKRLRAKLLLRIIDSIGGDSELGIPPAVACELLHNATLVHDDIQDGDRVRRGKPTLWVTEGINQAINTGDMMLVIPPLALEDFRGSDETKWKIGLALSNAALKVVNGQAKESLLFQYVHTNELENQYLQCIRGKTAALFVFLAKAACIVAKREHLGESAARIFENLGMLFQIQDDVLDLFGNKGRGRNGEDLREGKMSFLVVKDLEINSQRSAKLVEFLRKSRSEVSDEEVGFWTREFERSGALSATVQEVKGRVNEILYDQLCLDFPTFGLLVKSATDEVLAPIRDVC